MEQISPASNTELEDPLTFCLRYIETFKKKADHNKNESLNCFVLVIVSTLAAPVFLMLGNGWFFEKLLPSCLSLLAAGATAWIQLRKPQQLWAMYRDAQRQLEDHKTRFSYKLPPYSEQEYPEKLLVGKVAEIALDVHYQWMPLVPSPDYLPQLESLRRHPTLSNSDKKDGNRI